jgi:hypothetical protein
MLLPSLATSQELREGFEQRLNFVIAISADVLSEQPYTWTILEVAAPIFRPSRAAANGFNLDLRELDAAQKRKLSIVALDDWLSTYAAAFDRDPTCHPLLLYGRW